MSERDALIRRLRDAAAAPTWTPGTVWQELAREAAALLEADRPQVADRDALTDEECNALVRAAWDTWLPMAPAPYDHVTEWERVIVRAGRRSVEAERGVPRERPIPTRAYLRERFEYWGGDSGGTAEEIHERFEGFCAGYRFALNDAATGAPKP